MEHAKKCMKCQWWTIGWMKKETIFIMYYVCCSQYFPAIYCAWLTTRNRACRLFFYCDSVVTVGRVGGGQSLLEWQVYSLLNSFSFSLLFTIKDQCKKYNASYKHSVKAIVICFNNVFGPLVLAWHTWERICISVDPKSTYKVKALKIVVSSQKDLGHILLEAMKESNIISNFRLPFKKIFHKANGKN